MMFRVGQKVICVNARPRAGMCWFRGEAPTKGRVYTISAIGWSDERVCFQLVELKRIPDLYGKIWGYGADRFRPVIEKKTDISFAHEILRKVTRKQGVNA